MPSKENIIEKIKSMKPQLREEFSVTEIGIFGSVSRDEADAKSDLDVLVSLEKRLGLKFFHIKYLLEETLGVTVDVVTKKSLHREVLKNIEHDLIQI